MQTNDIIGNDIEEFSHLVGQRRATPHFSADEVPQQVIDSALELARSAPSGYNFQPWRFLVVRSAERRAELKKAAYGQEKIAEAPVVIIAFAQRDGWKLHVDKIMETAGTRRGLSSEQVADQKKRALAFIETFSPAVWLNRHVMIAFTHLMLAVESLGWDTAPMEGFDAKAVISAFHLPADSEVVALLAIGRAKQRP